MIEHFSDPYLRDLERDVVLKIEERCREWAMKPDAFAHRFEAWFANFAERDKPLALKLFLHLDYFSEDKFDRRIADLSKPLGQHLYDTRRTFAHVLLVVPDERADSADRHAYVIAKAWRLPQAQVVTVSDLAEAPADRVLVFFNDTHGTGNQFVRDVTAKANLDRFRSVFIIALTIGEKAFKRFKSEIARATILPDRPTRV